MINSENDQKNRGWLHPAFILAASLFLLIPAFYNHYPIVNPDTATYLSSGFIPETPSDRPITYGLLIRLFSFNGLSLWPAVFIQALAMVWLILTIMKIMPVDNSLTKKTSVIIFLSLFSSLSWLVSQVQPDFFTPAGILAIAAILIGSYSKKETIALYAFYFVCCAVHLSHPLMFVLILCAAWLLKSFFTSKANYGIMKRRILILLLLTLAAIPIMGPAISKSKHVFLTGSLVEKGILKKYLDDNCTTHNYKICSWKDALPRKFDDFVWDENSPLYKLGSWKESKPELSAIDKDILTTPRYLVPLMGTCVKFSCSKPSHLI